MEYQFLSYPNIFIFFIFVFLILKIWKKLKSPNLPPGPWKLPVIGNMHNLIGSLPHRRLSDLSKKYGPLMHLQLGEISTYIISSPEMAKEVLKSNDINLADKPFLLGARYITYNFIDIAFSPYGDYWKQLRKICTLELLSGKRVQSFRSIREEEVSDLIKNISSNAGWPINLSNMLDCLVSDIIARAAFGRKCKDQQAFIPVAHQITELIAGFGLVDSFPSVKLLEKLSGTLPKLKSVCQEADRIFENIMNEHKASKAMESTRESEEADSLLYVLLNLQEHGDLGISLTTDTIKAIILDVFVGGTEGSTTITGWAISELLRNPRVMQKAQAEVRGVFDEKGNVDETRIHELQYLKLVIKETLRLHPSGPLLVPRQCRESCKINGYEIPLGSRVIVNAWAIGRDPIHWNQAESFYPERFIDNSLDYNGTDFKYLPFGAGRRICPGISFGIANIELPLAQLLYHFNWKLPNGIKSEELDMTQSFSTTIKRKNDLFVIPVPYHPLNS